MSEFLHMGGYAAYVWPSYALTAICLLLNVVLARLALRRARQRALQRIKSLELQNASEA